MIAIIRADGIAERCQLDAMRARAAEKNADIELAVKAIMENVRAEGMPAVERYSLQFDHRAPYELSKDRLDEAYAVCPKELTAALEHAARNIRDYNEKLLVRSMEWKTVPPPIPWRHQCGMREQRNGYFLIGRLS